MFPVRRLSLPLLLLGLDKENQLVSSVHMSIVSLLLSIKIASLNDNPQ